MNFDNNVEVYVIFTSRSVHDVPNGRISFFFKAELHSVVCIYHIFFIHSSVDGNLGCFQILTVVNHAAISMVM